MLRSAVSRQSLVLGDRLDALARALQDAGVPPERAERLLARAAAATLDAVALGLIHERVPAPAAPAAEASTATAPREPKPASVPLAA
ncbi:MAG: hypothetical protein JO073_01620 [Actinobacteria bacterium]|nr:hypothetical protein [Actinomycetota bacterium]